MRKEIWRDVVGYEGCYQVSNFGNVRSLDRIYSKRKGRMLKLNPNSNGYLMVHLYLDGKRTNKKVHQLVAESFLDHEPCGYKLVVDHIDNDKLNNNLNNLQVITNRENLSKDKTGGTSRYVGVSWKKQKNKFVAQCWHNNKLKYLRLFNTEQEASKVYNNYLNSIT